MKSRINTFLLNALVVTLAIIFSTWLSLSQIRDEAFYLAKTEQEEAIKTFWQLLRAKGGDFRMVDGRLMAGDYVINGNYELPDKIRDIFGGTATIFMGDTRVSTNVLKEDGTRAVGTKLIGPAREAIFTHNLPYRGEAPILGIPYLTAYDPIRNRNGETIGVLYTGVKKSEILTAYNRLKFGIIAGTVLIEVLFIAVGFALLWERYRYEELLRESAQKYRTLFENSAEGIFLLDESLAYLDCNEQAARLFGCNRSEIIGKNPLHFSPPVQPDGRSSGVAAQQLIARALTGSPSYFPWQHQYADGTRIDAEISLKAMNIKGRTVLQATLRDITEQVQTEARIREVARVLSEISGASFFSSLVEHIARILQAEYAFIGELDRDAGDTVRVMASFAHGKAAKTFSYALAGTPCAEVAQGATLFYPEGVSRLFPGNRLLADMNAEGFLGIPLKLADGRVVGIMAVLDGKPLPRRHDTDSILQLFAVRAAAELNRLHDETRLREMAEQIRLITDSVPASIAYVDTDLRYRFANRRYEELFGLSGGELVGRSVRDTVGEAFFAAREENVRQTLAGNGVTFLSTMTRGDGSTQHLQTAYIPHWGEFGRIAGYFVQHYDVTDLTLAQEALRVSEERYRTVFDTTGTSTFIIEADTTVSLVNGEFTRLSGYSREEVEGKMSWTAFVTPASVEWMLAYHRARRANAPSVPSVYECDVVRKDGAIRRILAHVNLIPGTGQSVASFLDITESKQMADRLRNQLDFLQALIDTIPSPIFYKDREGRYLGGNLAFESYVGLAKEQLIGKTAFDLAPRDLADRYHEMDEALFTAPGVQVYESSVRYADGTRHEVIFNKATFTDKDGGVGGLVGVILDVTERKRAEDALKQSEERFHQIFVQNGDAIILFRFDGSAIIDANPAAEQLTGYTLRELRELTPSSFIDPEDFQRLMDAIPPGDYSRSFQMDRATSTRKNGGAMFVAIRGKILRLGAEYIIYCSIRDITEKTRLKEEIRTTQAKLIQANKMTSLGMLASSVAHEINNPNNCIAVNASMLADAWQTAVPVLRRHREDHGDFPIGGLPCSEMEELAPRLFSGIVEGSRRINAIVANMKDYVKPDQQSRRVAFDVNRAVRDAATILWHHIHKYSDHFTLSLEENLPNALGSMQQIEQVVINLISNALQALPGKEAGVSVATSFDRGAGHILVTIEDGGRGMGREVLQRLTEPFFTTRSSEGGTGLGVYISASIVKEHGGTLEFDSEPGRGTTATIRLRVA